MQNTPRHDRTPEWSHDPVDDSGQASAAQLMRERALAALVAHGFEVLPASQALASVYPHLGDDITLEHLLKHALTFLCV